MGHRFFCYGTLQVPEVVRAVVGRPLRGGEARLLGYGVFRVKGAEYPGMVPSPAGQARGLLYEELSDHDLVVLDAFEGALYERTRVEVLTRDGAPLEAWAYRVRTSCLSELSAEPWDLDAFVRKDRDRFLSALGHEPGRGGSGRIYPP